MEQNGLDDMKRLPARIQSEPMVVDWEDPEIVKVIRETCAPDATDPEFKYFMMYAKSTGLNPLKKEVWFIKTGGKRKPDGTISKVKIQVQTGINGFFTIANDHPAFNGMSDPEFAYDEKRQLLSCTIRAYRKDRAHPITGVAFFSEYFQKGNEWNPSQWEKKPRHMLAKVAKSIALRECFPQQLGGLYTEDEMGEEDTDTDDQISVRRQLNVIEKMNVIPTKTIETTLVPERGPRTVTSEGDIVDMNTGEVVGKVNAKRKEGPYTYDLPYELPGVPMDKIREQLKKKFGEDSYNPDKKTWNVPRKLENNSLISFDQYLIAVSPAAQAMGDDDINI